MHVYAYISVSARGCQAVNEKSGSPRWALQLSRCSVVFGNHMVTGHAASSQSWFIPSKFHFASAFRSSDLRVQLYLDLSFACLSLEGKSCNRPESCDFLQWYNSISQARHRLEALWLQSRAKYIISRSDEDLGGFGICSGDTIHHTSVEWFIWAPKIASSTSLLTSCVLDEMVPLQPPQLKYESQVPRQHTNTFKKLAIQPNQVSPILKN